MVGSRYIAPFSSGILEYPSGAGTCTLTSIPENNKPVRLCTDRLAVGGWIRILEFCRIRKNVLNLLCLIGYNKRCKFDRTSFVFFFGES